MKELIIDCFAGGGGASVGIEMALGRQVDIAINHDPDAILMHKANHPSTLHLTEDIFEVDLKKYVRGRQVALMWASPDCTSHSKAKGGKPREKGLRMLPWAVYKHAKSITPHVILMENVEEIQQWGPLDKSGYPIKERKGEDYRRFISAMTSLGYEFDCRELIAADYGAPTTRKRWYAIFRRDGKEIIWPKQTHSKDSSWVPISSVIDWSDLGKSIFTRKKELAENTLNRITRGIDKFIINNPDPFFLPDKQAASFLIQYHTETKVDYVRGQVVTEPIKTLDTSNRYGLVSAFLIKYYGTGTGQSMRVPLGTIVTKDRFGMVTVLISGEPYRILDIRLRMLKPEELKMAQGFPTDYVICKDHTGKPYPVSKQVARIGNSVVPIMAKKLVEVNCPYLKLGERMPNVQLELDGQFRFA